MILALARLALALVGFTEAAPSYTVVQEVPSAAAGRARLVVEVEDTRAAPRRPLPLPVRAIVTAADGAHPDGSGRGTYADGRFFTDGHPSPTGISPWTCPPAARLCSCTAGRTTSPWN
jgi:hypothetical protein